MAKTISEAKHEIELVRDDALQQLLNSSRSGVRHMFDITCIAHHSLVTCWAMNDVEVESLFNPSLSKRS
jgi:hypothetical protein